MKKLFVILFLLIADLSYGQTFSEFFKQNKTQKKYLLQQIAGLQIYLEYAGKGYKIAEKGINVISSIKNGDLNRHEIYFNGLKLLNPRIRNHLNVLKILSFRLEIIAETKKIKEKFNNDKIFETDEKTYISQVYNRLNEDSNNIIDILIELTTNSKLIMNDDERLQRLDSLFNQMEENYNFCRDFSNETLVMAKVRQMEMNDISKTRILIGIKK